MRPAAAFPALCAFYQGALETRVNGVHHLPGSTVAQAHFLGGGGYGPFFRNGLKEVNFPRSERYFFSYRDSKSGPAKNFSVFGSGQMIPYCVYGWFLDDDLLTMPMTLGIGHPMKLLSDSWLFVE